jgi:TIR domain
MSFEHACFVSYRHHEQSQLAEQFIEQLCDALRNELTVMLEEGLYIDRERLRGGAFFNPSLSRALCKSICMIAIYTPTYFSRKHCYCAREYRAMEVLEASRLARVHKVADKENGLIIPIVMRGESSLPDAIKGLRHYYSFEHFSLSAREMPKNKKFEKLVREIAEVVFARKLMFNSIAADVTSICDSFAFPTEEDVHPWLDAMMVGQEAFPFRTSP